MSLFTRPIRPADADLDGAVQRHLETLRTQVTPDPLFRRRLRGHAINRYVAARERIGEDLGERRHSRTMGRLGRAVLVASVTLAASAATALGASQDALPGDPLYGLKLRVETLRFDAVPARLHPLLAADVVGERIEEMDRLIAMGRTSEASALEPEIAAGLARLRTAVAATGSAGRELAAVELAVLEAYINRLPARSKAVIGPIWASASSATAPDAPANQGNGRPAANPAPVNRAGEFGPPASVGPDAPGGGAGDVPHNGVGPGSPGPGATEPRDPSSPAQPTSGARGNEPRRPADAGAKPGNYGSE